MRALLQKKKNNGWNLNYTKLEKNESQWYSSHGDIKLSVGMVDSIKNKSSQSQVDIKYDNKSENCISLLEVMYS